MLVSSACQNGSEILQQLKLKLSGRLKKMLCPKCLALGREAEADACLSINILDLYGAHMFLLSRLTIHMER